MHVIARLKLAFAVVIFLGVGHAVDAPVRVRQVFVPDTVGGFAAGTWRLDRDGDRIFSASNETFGWGSPGDIAVVGDWNGDGVDDLGVFSGGSWFIDRNGDGLFDPTTEIKGWGVAGWTPMPGDWNGDGITDLGVVSPDSIWFRDLNGDFVFDPATEVFGWGSPGNTPVVADWNGDGRDKMAVFADGMWFLDRNGDGLFDPATEMKGWGVAGWTPVPGDWNGDGITDLGVVSPDSAWFRDLNGDFLFDASTEILGWGSPGDVPVAGDWDGDGRTDPAVFSGSFWFIDLNGNSAWEPNEIVLGSGQPGEIPVAGRWGGMASPNRIQIDPPAGASGVELNRRIILTLPAPVNPATVTPQTVQVVRDGMPFEVTRRVSADGRYVMIGGAFKQSQNGQSVVVAVNGLIGADGRPLSSLRATLTAGQSHGFGSFGAGYLSPVPTNAVLYVRYSERIDPTSFFPDQWRLFRRADSKSFDADCELDANWRDVICQPLEPLSVGAEYTLGGGSIENLFSSSSTSGLSFTVGFDADFTPPQPIGSAPADGAAGHWANSPVLVYFDEPIIAGAGSRVELARVGGSLVEAQVTSSSDRGHALRISPVGGVLQPDADYQVTVEGVRNLAGLPMVGRFQATFRTSQSSDVPCCETISPAFDEEDVPLNANILLISGAPVIPGSATDATFSLWGPEGRVPAEVRVEANGMRVVLDPLGDLGPDTLYRAETTSGLVTVQGRELRTSWRFRTGVSSDTTPPSVQASWPPNGAVNQPLRTRPSILLNEDYAGGSVSYATVRLTAEDGSKPGQSLRAAGRSIAVEPSYHDPLKPNTLYRFEVDGVTDRAGNPLPPFVSSFRTGSFSDGIRPSVVSMTPAPGSVDVGLQPTIELTLNELVNPATVTPETTSVGDGPVAVSVINGGLGIRITPLTPLRPNTLQTVVCMATDPSGNYVSFLQSPTFTTGAGPQDSTAPQVSEISIPDGAVVPLEDGSLRYRIVFSEPVRPETVTQDTVIVLANGRRVNPSLQSQRSDNQNFFFEVNGDVLRTAAQAQYDPEAYVEIAVTNNVLDIAGNSLAPEVTRGFRVPFPDTSGSSSYQLWVKDARPGEMGASTMAPITLIFSKRFVASDLSQTLFVSQEGRLVAGHIDAVAENRALRFTPDQPWSPGALVQAFVRANVVAADGGQVVSNPLVPQNFKIIDPANPGPPQVVSFSPPTVPCCGNPERPLNASWMAKFSEPIDPATVTTESVRLTAAGGQLVPATVHLVNADTVEAVPTQPLEPNRSYRLELTSLITDLDGDMLPASASDWVQPKGPADFTSPAVVSVSPPDGSSAIPLNSPLRARFSEALNPTAIRPGQLQLVCGGIQQQLGDVSLSTFPSAYKVVEAVPEQLLPASQSCTAMLSGMTDIAGNPAAPVSWSFQTGTAVDTDGPERGIAPPQGSEVGINSVVTIRFEEPIDPTSIEPNDIRFTAGDQNQVLTGQLGLSEDGLVFYFIPDAPLPVGLQHSLNSNNGFRDLAGNSASFYPVSFTTGFAPDTTPPSAVEATIDTDHPYDRAPIEDGARNVTPFFDLRVVMSEELDPATVTTANVQLLDGGSPTPIDLDLLGDRRTLQINALSILEFDRTYTVRISGLKDPVGNAMTAPYLLTFTTKPSLDFTRPTAAHNLDAARAFGGEPGVYRNIVAKVRFSEAMDPTTIRPDTIYYYDTSSSSALPSTPILDASGTLVQVHPDAPLPPNAFIELKVSDQAMDLAGNPFRQQIFPFGGLNTSTAVTDGESPVAEWPDILTLPQLPTNFPWGVLRSVVPEALDPWSYEANYPTEIVEVRDAGGNLVQHWTNLAPLSSYTLTVKSAADYAGNPVIKPAPLTVVTGGGQDTVKPSIVGQNPGPGATGVDPSQSITIDFSERVWVDSFTLFQGNSGVIPVNFSLSGDGMRLTIDPIADLLPNTVYGGILYAYDLGNNNLSCCSREYNFQFTTGGPVLPDNEPPVLLSINPPDGAVDVMDPQITLTYSEPLDQTSVQSYISAYVNGELREGSVSNSADGATVYLSPYGDIPDQAQITVLVADGLTDRSGNPAAALVSRFTYLKVDQPEPDQSHIQAVRPPAGATDVAQDASIYVFFNGPIDPASLTTGAVRVSEDGVLISGQILASSQDQVVEFRPDQPFAPSALVRLFLDQRLIQTPSGTPLSNWLYQSSFVAAGGPISAHVQGRFSATAGAPRNAHLVVDFDRPMDPATFTTSTVTLGNPTQLISFALENGNTRLRVIPDALMPANAYLRLQLSAAITAMDGTPLSSNWRFDFQSGDHQILAPASLTSISPPDGAMGVGVNGTIDLVFSDLINPLSVNDSTIQWSDGNGSGVACSIVASRWQDRTTVRITPHDPFTPSGAYTLTVAGVEDMAGNIVATRTASFTAGEGPDFQGPRRTSSSPEGVDAPLNTVAFITFDEPLGPGTVNESSVAFSHVQMPSYTTTALPATVSLSSDARTIFVTPDALLAPFSAYRVEVTQRVQDVSGNPTSFTANFTTGASSDVTPPQLLSSTPADGASGVPINQAVILEFDSPLRPESVSDLVRIEAGGVPIPVQRIVSGPFIELRPTGLFDPFTSYTWIVEGVEDLGGNALPAPVVGTFSTGQIGSSSEEVQVH